MSAFAAVPLNALSDRRLTLTDIRVLGSVASFAAPSKPVCWPSRSAIGARIGIASESRISKHLHRLQDFGLIEITPRQGSNLYRLLSGPTAAPDAPEQPCTPPCTAAVHPAMHGDQNIEQTQFNPPAPPSAPVTPRLDQEQQQRELQQRQANPSPARSEAVQRLLEAFKTHCGVEFPSKGATARTIERRIDEYGEQTLTRIIEAKGPSFRVPTALLKPALIESINAELSRPTPATPAPATTTQEKPRERRWFGIGESILVKHARPGEDFETVAYRLLDERARSKS